MSEQQRERMIAIVGSGGVGFYTAIALSRSGILGITVFDDDDLRGGLGSSRLPLATPTTRKVDLLRGFIRVNFGEPPAVIAAKFTGNEVQPGDIVVDCSDMSGVARRRVWTRAAKRGARCIRVSYDGANSTVVVAEGLPMTTNEAAAGYANVPSLALSMAAGGIAGEVISRLMVAPDNIDHIEFQISLAQYVVAKAVAA